MTIKQLRLRFERFALDLETLDCDSRGMKSIPDYIVNEIVNVARDVKIERDGTLD